MKVRCVAQPEWGIGHVVELLSAHARVLFPSAPTPILLATRDGAVLPVELPVGARVRLDDGTTGVVAEALPKRRYQVTLADGALREVSEDEVRAQPQEADFAAALCNLEIADARAFLIRRRCLELDDERRGDALGALFASRLWVKPHQLGVVQRLLTSTAPRFILADEVGLGKTIEAGMTFTALRLAGLARRVLVVVPAHLLTQWLVELSQKFHHLFTLLDSERLAQVREDGDDPWSSFELVVTSAEALLDAEEEWQAASSPSAYWDLVIIDEVHSLKHPQRRRAAEALARNCWGLLLLTATPLKLDYEEYRELLVLIDPLTAPSVAELAARVARQEELAKVVRTLLEGGGEAKALAKLTSWFPDDPVLARRPPKDELLDYLAETYSLSAQLIRNRRAHVGGFEPRHLQVHAVPLTEDALALYEEVRSALASQPAALRALDASPEALAASTSEPNARRGAEVLFQAKVQALVAFLRAQHREKVLVFAETPETLFALEAALRHHRLRVLSYHERLGLIERERCVARFQDPEGPMVLLSTELGGEGRNFQFACHLVCFDLPWSPAAVEQRIGRLDRLGQTRPVHIHVFETPGTVSALVLELYRDAIGVFGEPIGGLDALLETVAPRLAELASGSAENQSAYRTELRRSVEEARRRIQESLDPLLDRRSFDRDGVERLLARAQTRAGLPVDDDTDLETGLLLVARDLDERLESVLTDVASRLGIRVDSDEEVEAFQTAFHFGHALNIEALPGIDISREHTLLGTFWRDTAVATESLEYFATGHPLVEALFAFVRDGPFGRNGARVVKGPIRTRGLECLFHLVLPEGKDTELGARVASRQAGRYLGESLLRIVVADEAAGPAAAAREVAEFLREEDGRALNGTELAARFPAFRAFAERGLAAAQKLAEEELAQRRRNALARIAEETARATERTERSLAYQGAPEAARAAAQAALAAHRDKLEQVLAASFVELDSVAGFILESGTG